MMYFVNEVFQAQKSMKFNVIVGLLERTFKEIFYSVLALLGIKLTFILNIVSYI